VEGDVLTWYLDADGNSGTGDVLNGGAEYKVVLNGRSAPTPDDPPSLNLHLGGGNYGFVKNIVARGGTGFNVDINDLSTPSGGRSA